ncbi:MAG: hypothetical protein DRJ35_05050 [Thermoprotei archaeon]|nr:MAG: hypothetical protein DRJ35_05050 [Thermoprotei archaeon]
MRAARLEGAGLTCQPRGLRPAPGAGGLGKPGKRHTKAPPLAGGWGRGSRRARSGLIRHLKMLDTMIEIAREMAGRVSNAEPPRCSPKNFFARPAHPPSYCLDSKLLAMWRGRRGVGGMGVRESTSGKATVIDNIYRSVLLCRLAGLGFAETKRIIYSVYGRAVPMHTLKDWYYGRRKHRLSRLNSLDRSLFYHKAYEIVLEIKAEHPGWGYKRVATELNKRLPIRVPSMTIYFWITGRSRPNVTPVRVVPELGYLAGVLVGDYRRTGGGLSVKDWGFIEYYVKVYEKVTGVRLEIHEKDDDYYGNKYFYTKENGGFLQLLWKTGLWKTIAHIYPMEFLQGLFDSEGTISYTPKSTIIKITTGNKEVLATAKTLLESLGYKTHIYEEEPQTRNLRGEETAFKGYYILKLAKPKAILKKFATQIGFRESKRQTKLQTLLKQPPSQKTTKKTR